MTNNDDERGRNPVLAYADSYRSMAKQGVESVPIWGVITDLERNIMPLYTALLAELNAAPTAPMVPDGLRLALSNAGIAAPESDEMLFATHEKYVQMLVTWVKDRKSFTPAPVVVQEGKHWYLVSWCTAEWKLGTTEIWFDHSWRECDMRRAMDDIAKRNNIDSSSIIILSVFPMNAVSEQEKP